MFSIYDGRTQFYQWDLDRKLIVNDSTIEKVHFCNRTGSCSLVRCVYEVNGMFLVDVPNIILQDSYRVNVYGFDKNYTKHSDSFNIVARTKPEDYVYTEAEVAQWEALEARVTEIEEKGVNPDMIAAAVEDYLPTSATVVELQNDVNEAYVKAQQANDNLNIHVTNLNDSINAVNAKTVENYNALIDHEKDYRALKVNVDTLEGNVDVWRNSHMETLNDHNRRLNDHESRISELEKNGGSGEGEGANLPEGMPGQYLVTDADGNVAWADEKTITIEELFDLDNGYSYTCTINEQKLYEIVTQKRSQEYNIEYIGEDKKKYTLTNYSYSSSTNYVMLYFTRVNLGNGSQTEVRSRVVRLSNQGVFTYYNAFSHNIPNIANPGNNTIDYVLHIKNGSYFWAEHVESGSEEEEEPNVIQLVDNNGTLEVISGEFVFSDLAMLDTKILVIKYIGESDIQFDAYEFSGMGGNNDVAEFVFASGNKRIVFDGETYAYAESTAYTKEETDAAIAAAIAAIIDGEGVSY